MPVPLDPAAKVPIATELQKLAPDVMELTLKLPASERLRFLPGQYIDILLKDGTRRGFSLANAPFNDQVLELHVRHVPNGKFTSYVFNEMQIGTVLVTLTGEILGMDKTAAEIGSDLGWNIRSL